MDTSIFTNHQLRTFLWQPNTQGQIPQVFAIVDGARDKRIEPWLNNSDLEHGCLFEGRMSYALKRAAPHIACLEPNSDFTTKMLNMGWGQSWGVFAIVYSPVALRTVRRHCRKINRVISPDDKKLTFRYYDPRVFRTFLPACNAEELRLIFGPVTTFAIESSGGGDLVKYYPSSETGQLEQKSLQQQLTLQQGQGQLLPDEALPTTENAPGLRDFFRLRTAHIEAFNQGLLEDQFQVIKNNFLQVSIKKPDYVFKIDGRPVSADDFLRPCFHKALEYKINLNLHILRFFYMAYEFGWGFWLEPEIDDILAPLGIPERKLAKLERTLVEQRYADYI